MYLLFEFSDGYKVCAENYTAEELRAEESKHGSLVKMGKLPPGKTPADFFRGENEGEKSGQEFPENPPVVVEEKEEKAPRFELSGAVLDKLVALREMRSFYERKADVLSDAIRRFMALKGLDKCTVGKYELRLNKKLIIIERQSLQEVLPDVFKT